ncbi:PDZK1-interacting protein 1 [Rhinatrema bivittatum]|uniref:PDZK1-interacting protein 1 n=1 Tax=Rhinatrema bivittatum TaxID=194408 RepID=UPI00112CA93B|nr:PDZK1-interacting protein 1 [Rhinatrema bivittatum]
MFSLPLALLCIFTSLGSISCQHGTGYTGRSFPQWATGLIAVSVFLFLVLVVFIVNRVWCEKKRERKPAGITANSAKDEVVVNGTESQYSNIDSFRSRENENAYDNPIELEEQVIQMTAM